MIRKLFPYILIYFFYSCEDNIPVRDNPLDDESVNYISPTIELLTELSVNDTIYAESLTLQYAGNESVSEFRFKQDDFEWTDWIADGSLLLDYLDEGNHQISAQSRYLNGDTSEVINSNYIVDAVSGPALMFYPRRHFAEEGQTVLFQILAEEVTNLMASEIHLEYDPTKIQIMSVSQGNFFQNSQNSIFIYDIDSELWLIQINTTLLDSDNPSVSGTGAFANIEVDLVQSGSSTISFSGGDTFLDPNNNHITILEKVNGLVVSE